MGYRTPAPASVANMRGWFRGIGLLQPAIALDHGQVPFWFPEEPGRREILTLYDRLRRQSEQVFPLEFDTRVDVPSDPAVSRVSAFRGALRSCLPFPR